MGPRVGATPSRDFRNITTSQADEESFDFRKARGLDPNARFTSTIGSIAHIVKGALGGGILSGHVGYMKAGVAVAIPLTFFFGLYMGYCLYLLLNATRIIYRRTRKHTMSYADVGEASALMHPNKTIRIFARPLRYSIDLFICMDLFGGCCCYQIIIASTIKQLVENVPQISFKPAHAGYPSLRLYLAIMIPFIVAICLIRHLKALAPLSIGANLVIVFCIFVTIYYAVQNNPNLSNLKMSSTLYHTFEFVGMSVFSMSCCGVVIPIESNMDKPEQYNMAHTIGMSLVTVFIFAVSFFGYIAFLENCVSPVTLNFPMTFVPKVLKGLMVLMIYVTHGLNFWAPFNLCFYYIKKKYAPEKHLKVEYIYRALFAIGLGIIAIIFPDINSLMGFVGSFAISFMAFIWPNVITLMVIWHRPGLGAMNWKLWRGLVLITIGIFIWFCGSMVNAMTIINVFISINK